jgi:hypothetical protein
MNPNTLLFQDTTRIYYRLDRQQSPTEQQPAYYFDIQISAPPPCLFKRGH